jgi:Amt family ammonium transporter
VLDSLTFAGMDGSEVLVVALACGALLIRAGFGWLAAGCVRSKNAAGAGMRNVVDLAVACVAFWAIGAAIMNAEAGLIFDAKGYASQRTFMQLVIVIIGTAPVLGAMAERSRLSAVMAAPAVLAGLVIPICASWVWNGWLARLGFVDVAGATVLHVVGGMFALIGAIAVGPRPNKYNRDGSANLIPGHNVPIVSVGVVLILIGWTPYVVGASMNPRAGMNVLLAASAGTLAAVMLSHFRYGKPDILLTYGGLLGALVAITSGGGSVGTLAAFIIGAIAGIIVPMATVALDLRFRVDDPSGGIAVHLIGGAWGVIAAGLFVPAAHVGEWIKQFFVQILGLLVIALFAALAAVGLFVALRKTVGLRLHEDAEYDGTDLAEHDVNAYPDFQQTMIKSYHLREA